MSESDNFNVVLKQDGSGVITWTSFSCEADFEKFRPVFEKNNKIIGTGVTIEEARRMVKQTEINGVLIHARDSSLDETGSFDPRLLKVNMQLAAMFLRSEGWQYVVPGSNILEQQDFPE
ncbi:hypothetical protein COT75_03190 [Candidatus Beckwithbacteria bacterium CG10_big_fil_rev_8_21_14_0_10_34_10]|uniref:Uncharacterized protein n=1 Tax=Candidatus Beckwithbacteria bacterium CG10_big_fil_rev_8_21_14_0_10_34_10 TaxID=1974495 RepID=A0A2H0W8X3_9BACT|nr:MAG: hypothetical protein COT75_03190 [Candidatus Beckwithbacteria bacterium CG10_big_fil_rev_8_21_14_0_10_34_10]